jgi:hypothetical protein
MIRGTSPAKTLNEPAQAMFRHDHATRSRQNVHDKLSGNFMKADHGGRAGGVLKPPAFAICKNRFQEFL